MKSLTSNEVDGLNRIREDVNITLEGNFSSFGTEFTQNLVSLSSVFVSLYFKILNHHPGNKDWKNRDRVFATNNFSNIVKNVTKIHAGYDDFTNLEKYLKENDFLKVESSFAEGIGNYLSDQDIKDNHQKFYFIIASERDIFSSFSSLEYIVKNKLNNIVTILYTKSSKEEVNKESRLNAKLIAIGLDTLVINGDSIVSLCDAIVYAKKLNKPTIILANVN